MVTGRLPLVGYVLTLDEEANVERAVQSLLRVTSTVVVVDSGSTDRTCALAEGAGATVWTHPFTSFSEQRNWALDEIAEKLEPGWIFSLDADECLDDELAGDLAQRATAGTLAGDAYLVRRRVCFDGRLLRWGGFANTRLVRLLRAGVGRYEDRLVNEHLALPAGARVGTLAGAIEHADVDSWARYIDKHNRYSTLEARARLLLAGGGAATTLAQAVRRPDLRRRWLRERVFDRLPARPALRFAQVYIFMGGALDGRAGFRRAVFEAWQEMCTDLKAESLAAGREP